GWIVAIKAKHCAPPIGSFCQLRIERFPQFSDGAWQRILEIFVLAAAESVPGHYDAAAEMAVVCIERGNAIAFRGPKQSWQSGEVMWIEAGVNGRAIQCGDAFGDGGAGASHRPGAAFAWRFQACSRHDFVSFLCSSSL